MQSYSVGSAEGKMYADLISTLKVERRFPIDPQLKEQNSPKKYREKEIAEMKK